MNVFAGEDYYFAREDEELYGSWVNLYYGTNPPQKLVYNPNGTGWSATNANSKLPDWKISDSGYSLCRISNSGKTLEYMNSHTDYPKEIDPKNSYYRKYNRK
jgi:hypothetical protein